MNSNRALWLAAVLCSLYGCATAPVQEMRDARQSLDLARSIEAGIHAPILYQDAKSAMAQADDALRHRDYGRARDQALKARQAAVWAKRFTLVSHDAQLTLAQADGMGLDDGGAAALLLRAEALATSERDAPEAIRLADAARRRLHRLVDAAPHAPDAAAPRAPSVRAATAQPALAATAATTYTVQPGDTLWLIAARPEIYGNPEYWPLIYRANRAELPSPDLLTAGQVLRIPHGLSLKEIDAAVSYARRRETWSADKVQPLDKAYLEHSRPR